MRLLDQTFNQGHIRRCTEAARLGQWLALAVAECGRWEEETLAAEGAWEWDCRLPD